MSVVDEFPGHCVRIPEPSIPGRGTRRARPARRPGGAGLAVTQRRVIRLGVDQAPVGPILDDHDRRGRRAADRVRCTGRLGCLRCGHAPVRAGPRGGGFASADPTAISLAGVTLAQLIVGILGVLFISNEYANGMIRSTFAAVPRRLPVLWAKAIVLGAVLAVVMVLASIAAFLVGQQLLGDGRSTTLAADGVLRAVIGSGLYLAGIGILGIAVGALMRNTAGAIAVVVASLLIIPGLASWCSRTAGTTPSPRTCRPTPARRSPA